MKVIVDAFGGDHAPVEIMKGAALAVAEYGYTIVLVGDEQKIRAVAKAEQISLEGMEILHAPDVIDMETEPHAILKEKKECSMAVGLKALADGAGDAFVTAGSTGALIMGSTFIVKRIKGVPRAAIAAIMPSGNGPVMLVDSGANVSCRPEMLAQFGFMGQLYMSAVLGKGKEARVGLLNVGTEDTKGDDLRHETFPLLKQYPWFVGNVEARDVPEGVVDVVVADGFSGNVLLKTLEGTAAVVMNALKKALMSNVKTKLAAAVIKPELYGMKKNFSASEYGGAPILGVKKPVIKAHGNTNAVAMKNAIGVAAEFASSGVIEKIETAVSKKEETDE